MRIRRAATGFCFWAFIAGLAAIIGLLVWCCLGVVAETLKQNTANQYIVFGPMVTSSTGYTVSTALTISNADIRVTKHDGSVATCHDANNAVSVGHGYYKKYLDATDTSVLGNLTATIYEAGYLRCTVKAVVLAANIYDSLVGATDVLDTNVTQWLGTAAHAATEAGTPCIEVVRWGGNDIAATAINGTPKVDVAGWSGTAIPGVDTAGYPKVTVKDGVGAGEIDTDAGHIAVVHLADALTTYTGNTPQTGDAFARIGVAGAGLTAIGPVTLANGAHGGAAATLNLSGGVTFGATTLGATTITNAAGTGLAITGTTHGATITGSAGPGVEIDGTTTGMDIAASNGIALDIEGTTGGVEIRCTTAAHTALNIIGTGIGMYATATDAGGVALGLVQADMGEGLLIDTTGNGGDAVWIQSGNNGIGVKIVGGTGQGGMNIQGGTGATYGLGLLGNSGGLRITAGTTGTGLSIIGGTTSGNAVSMSSTSGDCVTITSANDDALVLTGTGDGKYGLVSTISGNITGNLSGSVGSLTTWDKTGYVLSATGADLITKTSTFAAAMADALWDEAAAGHTTASTYGIYLTTIWKLAQGGR